MINNQNLISTCSSMPCEAVLTYVLSMPSCYCDIEKH